MLDKALNEAVVAWRDLLGDEYVLTGEKAQSVYGPSTTSGGERVVSAVVFPGNTEDVIAVVRIATQHHVSLYPISIGNNWGYGSASPATDNCVVVDLSRMKKIIQFDEELGLAKVEPGISFGELEKFLKEKDSRFMAPTNGAGPDTSLIGNALEKGYGGGARRSIDRFATLLSVEVVLPDGSRYASSNVLSEEVLPYYKWGVGPYIDGLFAQSNFGIVISATFSLSAKPEAASTFFFNVRGDVSLGVLTEKIREMNEELGSTLASLTVQSADRTFSDLFPRGLAPRDTSTPAEKARMRSWLKKLGFSEWVVIGSLCGNRAMIRVAGKVVQKKLSPYTKHVWVLGRRSLKILLFLRRLFSQSEHLRRHFYFLVMMEQILKKTMGSFVENDSPKAKKPSSGASFFVAAVPMKKNVVENFVHKAEKICVANGLRMPLRLLQLTERVYYVAIPLIFNKENKSEAMAAQRCYEELYRMAREEGVFPYRVNIDAMPLLFEHNKSFWQTADKIKRALDPDNIISPGRYSSYKGDNSSAAPSS